MTDFLDELEMVQRATGWGMVPAGDGRTVVLRRSYDAPIDDVWDAITDPDRIARWFLPVTGDFRVGGQYQIHGNAGGTILRCDPPRRLAITWVFGEDPTGPAGDANVVEVRLSQDAGEATVFELEHIAIVDAERWTTYGPGAVGVGWDLTLLGLALHLRGGSVGDPEEWMRTPEAARFVTESSNAWGAANKASGTTEADAATATENTTRFYVPES
jgi:uncharacterized protein YndB with AHSA1/START domain